MRRTISAVPFGVYQDEPVLLYTIENSHHSKLKVLSYAATWYDFEVQVNQRPQSLVYHFDNLAAYINTPYQVGKTVGRVAGCIGGATFTLNGQAYHLKANNGHQLLHGGDHGLQTHNFKGCFDPRGDTVTLTTTLLSADDGFPGDLTVTVSYTLTADDEVQISYHGVTTADTLFNPTCHVYFNLDGQAALINPQQLRINSTKLVHTDHEKVPTGVFYVPTPAYDFRNQPVLQTQLDRLLQATGKTEYDDCYVLDHQDEPAGVLATDHGQLLINTDRNGLVIFTANPDRTQSDHVGDYHALAVELQTLPDAVNHHGFGDTILHAGRPQTYVNRYRYVAKQ
ncbi:galactose mutarotase [Lactiplantibacillus paraplantarum]|uniref:aldose epimerase family protein n=1 Tax=Lactiplantibacillus paraplantarum TaxID=60520 RepID=UPI00051344FA|nr:aldose epimerase family protein [Lactiplantibacillus paraplantarum]OAX74991.1 galactose mutarotase [Lactiplantibacillus plantarum]ALO04155.1 aldose epimerase [Lactiplantibacillus paraplantarum]KGE74547.1 aldose epimerase [Lactiplantibacillus paraplantarum]MCW1910257.1 galactose mutarotase [Lactiplantibacillus paraplantarum]RDG13024.1 galactose mutarotase [Lactiplantibacillus paraplantarum]